MDVSSALLVQNVTNVTETTLLQPMEEQAVSVTQKRVISPMTSFAINATNSFGGVNHALLMLVVPLAFHQIIPRLL